MLEAVERLNSIGTKVDVSEVKELGKWHPEIDVAGVAIAAWERDVGYADPVSTTHGLAAGYGDARILG